MESRLTLQEVEGINIIENLKRELEVGLHKKTAIAFLQTLPENDAGFINLKFLPNFRPSRKGGYTHKAVVCPVNENGN